MDSVITYSKLVLFRHKKFNKSYRQLYTSLQKHIELLSSRHLTFVVTIKIDIVVVSNCILEELIENVKCSKIINHFFWNTCLFWNFAFHAKRQHRDSPWPEIKMKPFIRLFFRNTIRNCGLFLTSLWTDNEVLQLKTFRGKRCMPYIDLVWNKTTILRHFIAIYLGNDGAQPNPLCI